jgi:hypothetical protein
MNCRCIDDRNLQPLYTPVDTSLCTFKCDDGLFCGSFPSGQFVSIYSLTDTEISNLFPTRTISITSTPSSSPSSQVIFTSSQGSSDTGAIVGSVIAAILIILCITFAVVIYRRHVRNRPSKVPRLDAEDPSLGYLIDGVLPRTHNMIFSVYTSFRPRYYGELSLEKDELVVIKTVYQDQWALGVNMKTSETGYFPLGVLVSDRAWIAENFIEPPQRDESLVDLPGHHH